MGEPSSQVAPTPETKSRRSLSQVATELWRQSPGPRAPRPVRVPANAKEIVDGLDRTEITIGTAAVAFAVVLALIGYFYSRASHTKTIHEAATFLLVSNLIFAGILAFGLVIRRRALLGFGSFFFGLELTFSLKALPYGLPFIVFGSWLIIRANRKQKMTRSALDTKSARSSRSRTSSGSTTMPKASKRYTPPRRARDARR